MLHNLGPVPKEFILFYLRRKSPKFYKRLYPSGLLNGPLNKHPVKIEKFNKRPRPGV